MKLRIIKYSVMSLCLLSLFSLPSFSMDEPDQADIGHSIARIVRVYQTHFEGLMTDVRDYAKNREEQIEPEEWLSYWNDVEPKTREMLSSALRTLEAGESETVRERVKSSGVLGLQETADNFYNHLMGSSRYFHQYMNVYEDAVDEAAAEEETFFDSLTSNGFGEEVRTYRTPPQNLERSEGWGPYFYDQFTNFVSGPFLISPFPISKNLPATSSADGKEASWKVLTEKAKTIGLALPRSAEEIQDATLGQDPLFRNYVNLKNCVKDIQVMLETMCLKFN